MCSKQPAVMGTHAEQTPSCACSRGGWAGGAGAGRGVGKRVWTSRQLRGSSSRWAPVPRHHWAPWERLWGRGRPWKGLSWFSKALSSLLMAPSPGLLRRALRLPWEQPGGLQKGQAPGKELQVAGGSEPGSEPGQVEWGN